MFMDEVESKGDTSRSSSIDMGDILSPRRGSAGSLGMAGNLSVEEENYQKVLERQKSNYQSKRNARAAYSNKIVKKREMFNVSAPRKQKDRLDGEEIQVDDMIRQGYSMEYAGTPKPQLNNMPNPYENRSRRESKRSEIPSSSSQQSRQRERDEQYRQQKAQEMQQQQTDKLDQQRAYGRIRERAEPREQQRRPSDDVATQPQHGMGQHQPGQYQPNIHSPNTVAQIPPPQAKGYAPAPQQAYQGRQDYGNPNYHQQPSPYQNQVPPTQGLYRDPSLANHPGFAPPYQGAPHHQGPPPQSYPNPYPQQQQYPPQQQQHWQGGQAPVQEAPQPYDTQQRPVGTKQPTRRRVQKDEEEDEEMPPTSAPSQQRRGSSSRKAEPKPSTRKPKSEVKSARKEQPIEAKKADTEEKGNEDEENIDIENAAVGDSEFEETAPSKDALSADEVADKIATLADLDLSDMKTFLMAPIPKSTGIVQCYIERNKSGSKKMFPEYHVFLKHGDRFLMASKKRAKNRTSNYVISMKQHDISRESSGFIGKLRSNFLGTEFTIYDKGLNPKNSDPESLTATPGAVRQELGVCTYASNVLGSRGPRKMKVAVPEVGEDGQRLKNWQPTRNSDQMLTRFKDRDLSCLTKLTNKPPRWNESVGAYVLNFSGRVTMASVKNFQLVTQEDQESIALQFGRVGKDLFTMDFQFPLSPFQAFAICLSSFDSKLACE